MRNHAEQKSLIVRHIERIRQNPHFGTNVPIWVIPENNLGLESSHIEKVISARTPPPSEK